MITAYLGVLMRQKGEALTSSMLMSRRGYEVEEK